MKNKLPARLKRFTRRLQDEIFDEGVTNFYHAKRINLQRYNLERYFEFMLTESPDTILVGEAPGYSGCKLTGIPFSSEYIIREGVNGGKIFGEKRGYKVSKNRVKKEQTASAMWSVLQESDKLPLLWNAFPFHPYKNTELNSNRKPKAYELQIGKEYLQELINIFSISKVIAVGNTADETLQKMNIEHTKVRHPSYGGKKEFEEQLRYNLYKK